MAETAQGSEDTENALRDSNPDHANGVFSREYDSQFHFGVEGSPHSDFKVRFDWADGQSCTWMRKLPTPSWVSAEELSDCEGLFQDSYGNIILFLHVGGVCTAQIFRRGNRRNTGWTLSPPTVDDI